ERDLDFEPGARMNHGTAASTEVGGTSAGYVEALLSKLQDDVAARKQPRTEMSLKRAALWIFLCSAVAFELGARSVDSSAAFLAGAGARATTLGLHEQIDRLRGEADMRTATIDRLQNAVELSSRYGIGADLAMQIEDVALAEGI